MPRTARIVIPGVPHHITQRGNSGQPVFLDDEDRETYLALLRQYAQKHDLRVLGYCLMTNHVHIVAIPGAETALANAVGLTHQLYTTYFHDKVQGNGHLWQSRFFSCPMDEEHTINALAYAELNPVRAGMAAWPDRYQWSSARAHIGRCPDTILDLERWFQHVSTESWRQTWEDVQRKPAVSATIRRYTKRGTPLGRDEKFLERVKAWQERN